MPGNSLPHEVLSVIEGREGSWSLHAAEEALRLGLYWADVVNVARSASDWKRSRDDKGEALDGWKDAVVGRDTRGRTMYLAGKRVYSEGGVCRHVITFHEAD